MLSSEDRKKIDDLYNELAEEKMSKASEKAKVEAPAEKVTEHGEGEYHHSGEHHHSSERHHHHHHHHYKTKSGGFKKFLVKNKKGVSAFLVIAAAVAIVVLLAAMGENFLIPKDEQMEELPHGEEIIGGSEDIPKQDLSGEIKNGSVYVGVPVTSDEIYLVGTPVRAYISSDPSINVQDIVNKYREEGSRLDVGYPVTLSFDVYSLPENNPVASASIEISEREDFRESRILELDENYYVNIYHLKTGTEYHYKMVLVLSDKSSMTFGGTFKTAEGPRILSIGGIRNVRDIGGWKTTEGKVIKQGLLYRGTELDGACNADFVLNEAGFSDMINILGIRTDMDLRYPENSVPGIYALGASIEHKYYSGVMYTGIFTDSGKAVIKNIFSDLAKPEKYPVYLHCTYGADRTGTVCYLLEALLGMSEADLLREYELTGLFSSSVSRHLIEETIEELKTYEGEDMQEKVVIYLLSAGITAEEIESIRSIFLG